MSKKLRLAEIADVRPGYLSRKVVKPNPEGSHRILQIRDFSRDRTTLDAAALVRFTPDSISSVQPLQAGDVVFLARGAKNFAFAPKALPGPTLAAGYFFVLRPRSQVLPDYLAWSLNQPDTLRELTRAATSGARMPVVRRSDIENVHIIVPPLAVQNTIVELDKLKTQEQSLLQQLARKKNELVSTVCMTAARSGSPTGVKL